ncbi:late blight resistance homolog R1A-3 isoform X1 [Olea europaea subsp. europaea]|uniref:Late blight resistance homolog R1A-3 isoform X1 n=1 Tax=Olea europaea subsp. europaea TaxID=158383 RepID=A0A8S0PW78_OLEEU|nr:late blight resistance homolog R1A-3 isoform X1 [Olea europaea subsp. europaea]
MHLRPNQVEEIGNLLKDIEAVVNEVGILLYSFVLTIIIFILVAPDETNNAVTDMEAMVNEVGYFLHSDYSTLLKDIELPTVEFEETKNAMKDIKTLVNEVESFIDFFTSTRNDRVLENGILDMALSDLLPKYELMKEKIKDRCIAFSKMPSDIAPKIAVVLLFIVDSVLDDLVHLINRRTFVGVNNQIVTLHRELKLLQYSVADIVVKKQEKHEELVIRTRDIAYEIEYVINSFPPIWYLNLRLPQLIERIELIRMAIKEMKNTIDATRMPEVARYPHEQVSKQSQEHLFLEDIVVGFENEAIDIAEQLIGAPDKLQIVSICGMPGLGKTTLEKKLYNDPIIVYRFDERAWCVFSQTYNKRNILIEILRSIS